MNKRFKMKRPKKSLPSTSAEESRLQNPVKDKEKREGDVEDDVAEEKVKEEEKIKSKKRKTKMKDDDGVLEVEVEKKKVNTGGLGIFMSSISFNSLELLEKTLLVNKDSNPIFCLANLLLKFRYNL